MKWSSLCLGSFWNIKEDSYRTYIRAHHAAIIYENVMYIQGGEGTLGETGSETINSFIKYDIKSGEHEEICFGNELYLSQHSFSLLEINQKGYIFIFGGKKGNGEGSNESYLFDIENEEITKIKPKGTIPTARYG
jgi:carotenoid cleavage dioxygenase-like enzyme